MGDVGSSYAGPHIVVKFTIGLNKMRPGVLMFIEFCMRPFRKSSPAGVRAEQWGGEGAAHHPLSPLPVIKPLPSFLVTSPGPTRGEQRHHCL